MQQVVGNLSKKVINTLNLSIEEDTPIFLGESNITHMQQSHPEDYNKYFNEIPNILAYPDYIAQNTKDNSLEYVKEYQVNNEYVKVAVRVSAKGNLFARSVYVLNNNRVQNFVSKGTLKKIT